MNDNLNTSYKYAAGDELDRLYRQPPRKQSPFISALLFILILFVVLYSRSDTLKEALHLPSTSDTALEIYDLYTSDPDTEGNCIVSCKVSSKSAIIKNVVINLEVLSDEIVVYKDSTTIPYILIGKEQEIIFYLNMFEDGLAAYQATTGLSIHVDGHASPI